jgi:hypothetical protein
MNRALAAALLVLILAAYLQAFSRLLFWRDRHAFVLLVQEYIESPAISADVFNVAFEPCEESQRLEFLRMIG